MYPQDELFSILEFLFKHPDVVCQIHRHQRHTTSWQVPSHAHDDEVQFDLSDGYEGKVWRGDTVTEISGVSTLFFPVKTIHAYELIPKRSPSIIYSIKLRVPTDHAIIHDDSFSSVRTDLVGKDALLFSLERLYRLTFVMDRRTPLQLSILSEVLSMWPRDSEDSLPHYADGESSQGGHGMPVVYDDKIEKAIQIIERSLNTPPSLLELAESVELSQRHFVRRFRSVLSTSPHVYITRRRIIRAQELLAEDVRTVTEISDILGFPTIHSFSRWFTHQTDMSPSEFKEKKNFM